MNEEKNNPTVVIIVMALLLFLAIALGDPNLFGDSGPVATATTPPLPTAAPTETPEPTATRPPTETKPPKPTPTIPPTEAMSRSDLESMKGYQVWTFDSGYQPCKADYPTPLEGDVLEVLFSNGVVSWSTYEELFSLASERPGADGVREITILSGPFTDSTLAQLTLVSPGQEEIEKFLFVANCDGSIHTWIGYEEIFEPPPSSPPGPRG